MPLCGAVLASIAALLWTIDIAWSLGSGIAVDWAHYAGLLLLAGLMGALGLFYIRRRPDPALSAMLLSTAFLLCFSAGAGFLNALLVTVAGPRIDGLLAAADRALGFDWLAMARAAAGHPHLVALSRTAYDSLLPQLAALTVALGLTRQPRALYTLSLTVSFAALTVIAVWALFPSFGAFSVYALPPGLHLNLSLNGAYAQALVAMLRDGPGLISPIDMKGLIGFPSYHAVLALLIAAFAWRWRRVRVAALAWNGLVIAATPLQGGHHLVDLFGGMAVAALSLCAARAVMRASAAAPRREAPAGALAQTS